MATYTQSKKPLVLAILDGWGFSKKRVGNSIATAKKPTIDKIIEQYPTMLLQASGLAVGMTWGEIGNSEVGHLSIGAGRIVEQYLSRINRSIGDETFFSNSAISGAFSHAQKNNSKIHIIGLLTSGTVHANFAHLVGLIESAARNKFPETYLHLFLDGKDSGLHESLELLEKLGEEIQKRGYGKIATFIGRNLAMDRDNHWDLTQKTYQLLTKAEGEATTDFTAAIKKQHEEGKIDSAISPIVDTNSGFSGISGGDALIFFNFREDSMRQILKPFIETDFSMFPREFIKNLYIATMTQYLENPVDIVAFPAPKIINSLAEVLNSYQKKQLHIAESEKYAHVTFFFNGLNAKTYETETDIFIKSDGDHEKNPAMKCGEIADKVVEVIASNAYDFAVLNFANADVLAHTGNFDATSKGIETVDLALGLIMSAVLEKDGFLIVTADHGNAESLVYKTGGEPETKHNENPVPFYLVAKQYQKSNRQKTDQNADEISGILADVAPTILEIMGIPQPEEMTGKSLLSSIK